MAASMDRSREGSPSPIRRQVIPRPKREPRRREVRMDRVFFLIFLVCFLLVALLMM